MANSDSTAPKVTEIPNTILMDALEKLDKAASLTEFVQTISLIGGAECSVLLQPAQVLGLYHSLQSIIDEIRGAGALIDGARAQPDPISA